ncbi:MAG: putative acetyltransferase [Limisphaerales bacterium]|jgi:putative acetyltransferase
MMELIVREEKESEIGGIDAVLRDAFPGDDEAKLVRALRANGNATLSLVAEEGGEIVGHILFSPMRNAAGEVYEKGVGLAPMAVRGHRQRQGIGKQLIEASLRRLKAAGFGFVVVLGHLDYYPKFGFRRADELGIENEYGVGAEFMILELDEGAAAGVKGLIRYSEEFSAL